MYLRLKRPTNCCKKEETLATFGTEDVVFAKYADRGLGVPPRWSRALGKSTETTRPSARISWN